MQRKALERAVMWVNMNEYWLYKAIVVIVIMTYRLYKIYALSV